VVRRAQHALAPARGAERAGNAQDRRRLERLLVRERRQQPGKAAREHRLARPRRADHEQAQLSSVGECEQRERRTARERTRRAERARIGGVARQEGAHDVEQVVGAARLRGRRRAQTRRRSQRFGALRHQARRPGWQDEHARHTLRRAPQRERHRQRAVHRAQLAAERELAGELEAVERARVDLAGGGEDAEAIGRSKRPDSFGRSAGARLTVTRLWSGNPSPLVCRQRGRARAIPGPRYRRGRPG
jgi:hypothetical protein